MIPLTFWICRCLSGFLRGIERLLWGHGALGCLWCFKILRILRHLWCLRIAGLLRHERQQQRGVRRRRLRVDETLLLPWPSGALHIILSQVPDGILHIAARVGVPVSRWADLLEMICTIGNTQKPGMSCQIHNLGLANSAGLASW